MEDSTLEFFKRLKDANLTVFDLIKKLQQKLKKEKLKKLNLMIITI